MRNRRMRQPATSLAPVHHESMINEI